MVNCSMKVKGARSCIFHEMVNCTMVVGNLICYQSSKRNLNCGNCMVSCSMEGGSLLSDVTLNKNPEVLLPHCSAQLVNTISSVLFPWASARNKRKYVKIV